MARKIPLILLAAAWAVDGAAAVVAWSDDFNRASLGANWVILGSANAGIVSNELCFAQTNLDDTRHVYYQPWLTCSSAWTLRWTQRFGTIDAGSLGVGVGIKNFQAAGGNDRGYNARLLGAGASPGCMQILRWTGTYQALAASGPALALAAGDLVDCSLTRSNWTITATASNRANAQVSSTSIVFSQSAGLVAPTISRACFYPLGGTVYFDDVTFTLDHRTPARFILIGASSSEGYNATVYERAFVNVVQSNFTEEVCNDSGSWNSTSNSVNILPEILAQQPETAILFIGDNDLRYGYPAAQWQGQYSNLVAQLQAKGVRVKHCLPTPQSLDVTPLRSWILSTYPASDVIDTWTPLLAAPGGTTLNPAYDSGDGLHPNDAGHRLIGQIISSNLPAMRPPRFRSITWLPNRTPLLALDGVSNLTCRIEVSSNLLSWMSWTNLSVPSGTVQFTDPGATSFARRFYRAVWASNPRPPRFTSITGLPNGTPRFVLDAVSSLTCRIDVSSDLVHWTGWTNVLAPGGTAQFIDPGATNFAKRFYRAVWVP